MIKTKIISLSLLFYFTSIKGMEKKERLFFVCPWRSNYRKNLQQQEQNHATKNNKEQSICVFCDEESLKDNQIFEKNDDFLVLHNKFPYDADIIHFLVMPTHHIEDLTHMSIIQRTKLGNVISNLIEKYKAYSYGYKIGLNNGLHAGASIKHIHWHVIFYRFLPCSLPERVKKAPSQINVNELFNKTLQIYNRMSGTTFEPVNLHNDYHEVKDKTEYCYTCNAIKNEKNDDANLVFYRSKNFVVHFAHYPERVAQVCITPIKHGDIPDEHLQELYNLEQRLIPLLLKVINMHVRSVDSYNIQVSGNKHEYILITPRVNIPQSILYLDGFMGYHPADYKQLQYFLNKAMQNN